MDQQARAHTRPVPAEAAAVITTAVLRMDGIGSDTTPPREPWLGTRVGPLH